jgi:hypothetical protein
MKGRGHGMRTGGYESRTPGGETGSNSNDDARVGETPFKDQKQQGGPETPAAQKPAKAGEEGQNEEKSK